LKKLDRYIVLNVLRILCITELAGLALSLIIEFFEKMDVFTASLRSFGLSFLYLLLKAPFYFNQILPLAFLIAMLLVFIMMIRGNEMIVVRTSGISTWAIMRPLLALAAIFTVLSFLVAESVVPATADAAEYVYRVKIRKEESFVVFKNDRLWYKKDNIISNIEFFDAKNDAIRGLTVIELSPSYSISKRTDAEKGLWKDGAWIFTNVTERTFGKDGAIAKRSYGTKKDIIREPPSVFKVVQKNPEEMGYGDLRRHINRLKRSGHDVGRYLVDLYNKMAFPFVNVIMVFAAISVGLRYAKTKHISKGILSGMVLGVLYWFVHNVSLSLGYSEIFPPFFAAWFSNLLFLSAGILGVLSLRT
jgi:lipopolysaccharide export system permease protein